MADSMADSIRMAKIMKGMTGAGAGKAVTDEDIANNRRMMAERGMSDMESQNATTDMDAEKAGMIEKLMRLMRQETGNTGKMKESGRGMSNTDRARLEEIMGRKGMKESGRGMSNMDRSRLENMMGKRKGMMGGGSVKKYKGGGCVMPGRGKSRAMNK
jgi:hypothetical protein